MNRFFLLLLFTLVSWASNSFASHYFSVPYFTSESYQFVDPNTVESFSSSNGYTIVYQSNAYQIKDKYGAVKQSVQSQIDMTETEECITSVMCNKASVNAMASSYIEIIVNDVDKHTAYYSAGGQLISIVEGWPSSSENLKEVYESELETCLSVDNSFTAYQSCLDNHCLYGDLSYSGWLNCKLERALGESNTSIGDGDISYNQEQKLSLLLKDDGQRGTAAYFQNLNDALLEIESKCQDDDNSICRNVLTSSLEGEMSVDSSGQLSYVLPLNLPKGLNGVEPKLGLSYSSGQDTYLGSGFSLNGVSSVIGRCASQTLLNSRRAVQNKASDDYCLDGQKLVLLNGTQGEAGSVYTTEVDSNSRIVAVGGDSKETQNKSK
ncbi:exported hypothetical protein [uncultured Thiomicrorhabdus sp.]